MSFLDDLVKKANELDLETKARRLQEAATQAARQARVKAGDFTATNREKIDGYVERAGATVDEKTAGKYADTVAKVKDHVGRGVDKVAEGSHPPPGQPPVPPAPPEPPVPPAPPTPPGPEETRDAEPGGDAGPRPPHDGTS